MHKLFNTGQLDTVVLLLVDVIGSIVISLNRCCLPNDEGPAPKIFFPRTAPEHVGNLMMNLDNQSTYSSCVHHCSPSSHRSRHMCTAQTCTDPRRIEIDSSRMLQIDTNKNFSSPQFLFLTNLKKKLAV